MKVKGNTGVDDETVEGAAGGSGDVFLLEPSVGEPGRAWDISANAASPSCIMASNNSSVLSFCQTEVPSVTHTRKELTNSLINICKFVKKTPTKCFYL